jgi:hypothetical protein
MTAAVAVSEAGTGADTVAEQMSAAIAAMETATAADSVTASTTAETDISEAGAAADTVTVSIGAETDISEAGASADTVALSATGETDIIETAAAVDAFTLIVQGQIIVPQTGGPADGKEDSWQRYLAWSRARWERRQKAAQEVPKPVRAKRRRKELPKIVAEPPPVVHIPFDIEAVRAEWELLMVRQALMRDDEAAVIMLTEWIM